MCHELQIGVVVVVREGGQGRSFWSAHMYCSYLGLFHFFFSNVSEMPILSLINRKEKSQLPLKKYGILHT